MHDTSDHMEGQRDREWVVATQKSATSQTNKQKPVSSSSTHGVLLPVGILEFLDRSVGGKPQCESSPKAPDDHDTKTKSAMISHQRQHDSFGVTCFSLGPDLQEKAHKRSFSYGENTQIIPNQVPIRSDMCDDFRDESSGNHNLK